MDRVVTYLDNLFEDDYDLPVEWVIISPLAKGVDRIVARSILKKDNSRLQVLMPFSLDEYRNDFSDKYDLEEFNELLLKADPALTDNYINTQDSTSLPRTLGYLRVGKEVVDSCETLIAIWDGKTEESEGGTAEIIRYALERGRTILRIDAENPDTGATLLKNYLYKCYPYGS